MSGCDSLARVIVRACRFAAICLAILSATAYAEPHTFALSAPSARNVFLAGEMTNWDKGKLPMQKQADGKWRVSVDLAPGEWLYKFVVDGKWIADPGSDDHDADGNGGQHSFVFVGKGEWNERPETSKGRVDTLMLASNAWGKAMKVHVYLPPGFSIGKTFPVLWLLHGGGMDADQWLKTGKVNRYMDNLIARGAIRPFVIVMPSSEGVPYAGKSETFIADELPPWLQKTYGLGTDRARSGVAGMSMGGTGALRLPLSRPDRYGFGFALSGYFGDELIAALPKGSGIPMQLAFICGREDGLVATNRKLVQALDARPAKYFYREDAGGHTFHYWSNRMVEMLTAADAYFSTGTLVVGGGRKVSAMASYGEGYLSSKQVVAIETRSMNLSHEEIAHAITIPLETAVHKLAGVKTIRSSSTDGRSIVEVEYESTPTPEHLRQVEAAVRAVQTRLKNRTLKSVVSIKPCQIP